MGYCRVYCGKCLRDCACHTNSCLVLKFSIADNLSNIHRGGIDQNYSKPWSMTFKIDSRSKVKSAFYLKKVLLYIAIQFWLYLGSIWSRGQSTANIFFFKFWPKVQKHPFPCLIDWTLAKVFHISVIYIRYNVSFLLNHVCFTLKC